MVAEGADWFVHDHGELRAALAKHSVAFVGSGTLRWHSARLPCESWQRRPPMSTATCDRRLVALAALQQDMLGGNPRSGMPKEAQSSPMIVGGRCRRLGVRGGEAGGKQPGQPRAGGPVPAGVAVNANNPFLIGIHQRVCSSEVEHRVYSLVVAGSTQPYS